MQKFFGRGSSVLLLFASFSILAEKLPCKSYEPGCDQKFYRHYRAINAGLDRLLKENSKLTEKLGKETENAYHSVWLQ